MGYSASAALPWNTECGALKFGVVRGEVLARKKESPRTTVMTRG